VRFPSAATAAKERSSLVSASMPSGYDRMYWTRGWPPARLNLPGLLARKVQREFR
jgi:hypothetical protein